MIWFYFHETTIDKFLKCNIGTKIAKNMAKIGQILTDF